MQEWSKKDSKYNYCLTIKRILLTLHTTCTRITCRGHLIENQRNITHTVSLLSCGSWVRIPTGSHDNWYAGHLPGFFYFRLKRQELASASESRNKKKRACQGRRINCHVRSPVAQGQGMRSPADEHHPNRITSSKMLKINTVFRRKLIYVQRNPLKKKRCVVLFCIKLHQVAPLRLQTHLQAMATTKLYLDTRANALGTPAPVKISLCLNGKTVLYSTGVWKSGSTWPPVSENKVPPESGNKSVPYIRRSLSSDSPVKR